MLTKVMTSARFAGTLGEQRRFLGAADGERLAARRRRRGTARARRGRAGARSTHWRRDSRAAPRRRRAASCLRRSRSGCVAADRPFGSPRSPPCVLMALVAVSRYKYSKQLSRAREPVREPEMPSETRLTRTSAKPALDLPPPFHLVTLREVGDAFAHATKVAARGRRRHARLCRPLRSRRIRGRAGARGAAAHRAPRASMPAWRRSPTRCAVHAPPETPDRLRLAGCGRGSIGGLVGGGRLAWPQGANENAAAGLARVRRHDPHRRRWARTSRACVRCRPRSRRKASTTLGSGRLVGKLRAPSHGGGRRLAGEAVSPRWRRIIWRGWRPRQAIAPRYRRQRRSLVRRMGKTEAERRPLVARARRAVVARSATGGPQR